MHIGLSQPIGDAPLHSNLALCPIGQRLAQIKQLRALQLPLGLLIQSLFPIRSQSDERPLQPA